MSQTRRVAAAGACGAIALSAAAPLRAQDPLLLETFAARTEASTALIFGGLGLTAYRGPFGLRVSGALNFNNDARTTAATAAGGQHFGGPECHRFRCPAGGGLSSTQGASPTRGPTAPAAAAA